VIAGLHHLKGVSIELVGLEGVSNKTKAKILWDNCARLYPLAAT
jgi:hypothetical protein